MKTAASVDEYLSVYTGDLRAKLDRLRTLIRAAAPDAEEVISYGMPAYRLQGILVYFAAATGHIGFYPTGSGVAPFLGELTGYSVSKGTIRLPLDKPLPDELITRIVRFRVEENMKKAATKKTVRKVR